MFPATMYATFFRELSLGILFLVLVAGIIYVLYMDKLKQKQPAVKLIDPAKATEALKIIIDQEYETTLNTKIVPNRLKQNYTNGRLTMDRQTLLQNDFLVTCTAEATEEIVASMSASLHDDLLTIFKDDDALNSYIVNGFYNRLLNYYVYNSSTRQA